MYAKEDQTRFEEIDVQFLFHLCEQHKPLIPLWHPAVVKTDIALSLRLSQRCEGTQGRLHTLEASVL